MTMKILWDFLFSVVDKSKAEWWYTTRGTPTTPTHWCAAHWPAWALPSNASGKSSHGAIPPPPTCSPSARTRTDRSVNEVTEFLAAAAGGHLDPRQLQHFPWDDIDRAQQEEQQQGYKPLVGSPFDYVMAQTTVAAIHNNGRLTHLHAILYVPFAHQKGLMTEYRPIGSSKHHCKSTRTTSSRSRLTRSGSSLSPTTRPTGPLNCRGCRSQPRNSASTDHRASSTHVPTSGPYGPQSQSRPRPGLIPTPTSAATFSTRNEPNSPSRHARVAR